MFLLFKSPWSDWQHPLCRQSSVHSKQDENGALCSLSRVPCTAAFWRACRVSWVGEVALGCLWAYSICRRSEPNRSAISFTLVSGRAQVHGTLRVSMLLFFRCRRHRRRWICYCYCCCWRGRGCCCGMSFGFLSHFFCISEFECTETPKAIDSFTLSSFLRSLALSFSSDHSSVVLLCSAQIECNVREMPKKRFDHKNWKYKFVSELGRHSATMATALVTATTENENDVRLKLPKASHRSLSAALARGCDVAREEIENNSSPHKRPKFFSISAVAYLFLVGLTPFSFVATLMSTCATDRFSSGLQSCNNYV